MHYKKRSYELPFNLKHDLGSKSNFKILIQLGFYIEKKERQQQELCDCK